MTSPLHEGGGEKTVGRESRYCVGGGRGGGGGGRTEQKKKTSANLQLAIVRVFHELSGEPLDSPAALDK